MSDCLSKEDGNPKSPLFSPVNVAVHLGVEHCGLLGGRERSTERLRDARPTLRGRQALAVWC